MLQATTSEGLALGPYVAARVGFKSATLRMQGTETTTEPPTSQLCIMLILSVCSVQERLALL